MNELKLIQIVSGQSKLTSGETVNTLFGIDRNGRAWGFDTELHKWFPVSMAVDKDFQKLLEKN